MSKKDAVFIASRTLAFLFVVWALAEVTYLPAFVHTYLHYENLQSGSPASVSYLQHYYLLRTCFLIVSIAGYFLIARWLYKGGPEVEELLLPSSAPASVES